MGQIRRKPEQPLGQPAAAGRVTLDHVGIVLGLEESRLARSLQMSKADAGLGHPIADHGPTYR
jgi:hypothetical protein